MYNFVNLQRIPNVTLDPNIAMKAFMGLGKLFVLQILFTTLEL